MPENFTRSDYEALGRNLKRWLLGIVIFVTFIIISFTTITRIDPAHVGIRVKLAGSNRGVQDMPVVTGWVFYNPLTEQIIEFPTSIQNVVWAQSLHEGAPHDESITFSSSEGVNVNADIGLSFSIEPSKVPHLYLRFRKTDLMELANGYVRNSMREAFSDVASRMPVQEIYGAGKHKLVVDVTHKLNDVLGPDGFVIAQLTINGALRLPDNVAAAINLAMEATQNAIQAENRVRQVRAEAEQNIAQSHGQAEAARQRAQGEADAVLIRAHADATANEIIRLSATGTVLQWRALERWDGKLPMMQSGDKLPLLTFDVRGLGANDAGREKRLRELLEETAPKPAEKPKAEPAPSVASDKPTDKKADFKPAEAPSAPPAPPPNSSAKP
jgi:regulator of protease activity HflC (stomatin/prohibitin superfamily)